MRTSPPTSAGVGVVMAGISGLVVAVAVVAAVRVLSGVPVHDLVSDANAVSGTSPWTGALSTLGLLGWCIAATSVLSAARVHERSGSERRHGRFLLELGVLTVFVLVDDALQLHEVVLPDAIGLHEYVIYGAYAVVAVVWAWRWRSELRSAPVPLLLAAGAMGASTAFDAVRPAKDLFQLLTPWPALVAEELLKAVGIGALAVYGVRALQAAVATAIAGQPSVAPGSPPR